MELVLLDLQVCPPELWSPSPLVACRVVLLLGGNATLNSAEEAPRAQERSSKANSSRRNPVLSQDTHPTPGSQEFKCTFTVLQCSAVFLSDGGVLDAT